MMLPVVGLETARMLVKALGKMLDLGWQVVYFTMDDDIRARIADLGRPAQGGASIARFVAETHEKPLFYNTVRDTPGVA